MSNLLGGALLLCVLWALLGPLVSSRVEKRLEWFLLLMGALAATAAGAWKEAVVLEAILRPMKVCGAVLFGSLVLSLTHDVFARGVSWVTERIGPRPAIAGSIVLLGLAAAGLTSVISVLIFVEMLRVMRLTRKAEIHVTVLACFAIGMGGGLSPIGGPVPAVAAANLAGPPYEVGLDFLPVLQAAWLVPAILACAAVAASFYVGLAEDRDSPLEDDPLSLWSILVVTMKMYVFIAGLVLLGAGLVPLMSRVLTRASPALLFWINSVSAVVDGATLASVEVSPRLSYDQLRFVMVSLLVAGGILVPGHASNVVAAHKLGIGNREWAKTGLPFGAILMLVCFLSLLGADF